MNINSFLWIFICISTSLLHKDLEAMKPRKIQTPSTTHHKKELNNAFITACKALTHPHCDAKGFRMVLFACSHPLISDNAWQKMTEAAQKSTIRDFVNTAGTSESVTSYLIHIATNVPLNTPYAVEKLQVLIEFGADVNQMSPSGNYPLHTAIQNGQFPLVEALVTAQADQGKQDSLGNTPLNLAIKVQEERIAKYLVNNLLKLGGSEYACIIINTPDTTDKTALLSATILDLLDLVEILLICGGDIDYLGIIGGKEVTPRAFLAKRKGFNGCEGLLRHVARVRARSDISRMHFSLERPMPSDALSPLQKAQKEVLKALINPRCNRTLFLAILKQYGHPHITDDVWGALPLDFQLHELSSFINMRLEAGIVDRELHETHLIHFAASAQASPFALEKLQLFIDLHANVDERSDVSARPLHFAIEREAEDRVQLLLKAGARQDYQDNGGNTPLLLAVKKSLDRISIHCLNNLIDQGMDFVKRIIDTTDGFNNTPLLCAILSKSFVVTNALVLCGAALDINGTVVDAKQDADQPFHPSAREAFIAHGMSPQVIAGLLKKAENLKPFFATHICHFNPDATPINATQGLDALVASSLVKRAQSLQDVFSNGKGRTFSTDQTIAHRELTQLIHESYLAHQAKLVR